MDKTKINYFHALSHASMLLLLLLLNDKALGHNYIQFSYIYILERRNPSEVALCARTHRASLHFGSKRDGGCPGRSPFRPLAPTPRTERRGGIQSDWLMRQLVCCAKAFAADNGPAPTVTCAAMSLAEGEKRRGTKWVSDVLTLNGASQCHGRRHFSDISCFRPLSLSPSLICEYANSRLPFCLRENCSSALAQLYLGGEGSTQQNHRNQRESAMFLP